MLGMIQPGYESRIVGYVGGTYDGLNFQPPEELFDTLKNLGGVRPFGVKFSSTRALLVEVHPDSLEALAVVEGVTKVVNHIRELDTAKPNTNSPLYY